LLARFLQDNFCSAVVFFDLAVHFDHPALQLPDIANALQIAGKDDDHKRTQAKVVAKIQKVNPSRALFYAHDFACDTLDLANMLPSLLKGKTISSGEGAQQCGDKQQRTSAHKTHLDTLIVTSKRLQG